MQPRTLFSMTILLSAASLSAVTINGSDSGSEGYLATANNATTFDSSGGTSKSEEVVATADATNLYLFVEGQVNNTNMLFILIDSDGSNATGFSGAHPNGASTESNGLEFFNDFPDGGYDLSIRFRAGSGSNPPNYEALVIEYDTAGAIVQELNLGTSASTVDTLNGTVRSTTAGLTAGYVPGDGPNDGIEFAIPRSWLLGGGSGNLRVVTLNANGTANFWFDNAIPQLAASGSIGFTPGPDQDRLTALTAPVWSWSALTSSSVPEWNLIGEN